MNRHLKVRHHKVWEALKNGGLNAGCSSSQQQGLINAFFQPMPKEKTQEEIKAELINAVTNFVIKKSMPFSIVAHPSFRNMFCPFHKEAAIITNISADRVRDEVLKCGNLARRATELEVARHRRGSWTNDHWTGSDGLTYSTTTFHYIKNWRLRSIVIDFKVFHGTTSGEAIFNNHTQVLKQYTVKENIVIGITDTTASMGVLGQFLRTSGMEHAYCTDHNLQCNAILAFKGKPNDLCCYPTPLF